MRRISPTSIHSANTTGHVSRLMVICGWRCHIAQHDCLQDRAKLHSRTVETCKAYGPALGGLSIGDTCGLGVDLLVRVLHALGEGGVFLDPATTPYSRADDLLARLRERWDAPDKELARELADSRRQAAEWKGLLDQLHEIVGEFVASPEARKALERHEARAAGV